MKKFEITIIFLLLILNVEMGYLIYRLDSQQQISREVMEFDQPTCGKDIYEDLKLLNCRIYRSPKDIYGTTNYVLIPSYNAFLDLAKGKLVIMYQYLSAYYYEPSNKTHVEDIVHVLLITESQTFLIRFSWRLYLQGNVTEQVLSERQIPW